MTAVRLYHNPACSKSRAALALLQERGVEVDVVDYLATQPALAELRALATLLAVPAAAMLRPVDGAVEAPVPMDDEQVFELLQREPARLQRPLLVVGGRALIARPPERVLELLD